MAMIAPPWLAIPPNGYGGIENVLAALIPALMDLGVEIDLFTVGDTTIKATRKHWLFQEGQYNFIHKPIYDSLPVAIAHMMFAINYIKAKGNFDIVHCHNGFIGPFAWSLIDSAFPPVLHTLHGPPFTTQDRLDIGLPDNLPMWRELGKNTRISIVGISKAIMAHAPKELRPHILEPVHNGIDVSQFSYSDKKQNYFATLARFHPDKGQHIAIKLCLEGRYRLKMAGLVGDMTRFKQVLLELANPASHYRNIVDFRYFSDRIFPHLSSGQIEYLGDLAGNRKQRFLSHAKALLFPIQWDEPFGMAPLEALACGTPVIAMNRGAMPEIIEHGVNGFLANNEHEMLDYMKRVNEIDPAACRQSAEEKFSARHMAEEYIKRYRQILSSRPKPMPSIKQHTLKSSAQLAR